MLGILSEKKGGGREGDGVERERRFTGRIAGFHGFRFGAVMSWKGMRRLVVGVGVLDGFIPTTRGY